TAVALLEGPLGVEVPGPEHGGEVLEVQAREVALESEDLVHAACVLELPQEGRHALDRSRGLGLCVAVEERALVGPLGRDDRTSELQHASGVGGRAELG